MNQTANKSSKKMDHRVKSQTQRSGSRTSNQSGMNKKNPLGLQGEMDRRAAKFWKIEEKIRRDKTEQSDLAYAVTNDKPITIHLVDAKWWHDNCWKKVYPEFGPGAHQRVKAMPMEELLDGRCFQVGIKWAGEEQTENIWVELVEEEHDEKGERFFSGVLRNNSVFAKRAKRGSGIGPIYPRNIKAL